MKVQLIKKLIAIIIIAGVGCLWWWCWRPYSFDLVGKHQESTRGLAFMLALPAVFIGLSLATFRTLVLEEQSQTDAKRLVSETFAKSIELLGHEERAVRQGAIYALGKLAENEKTYHSVIMNTLCAYIRKQLSCTRNMRDEDLKIDIEAAIQVIKERKVEFDEVLEKQPDGKSKTPLLYDLSNTEFPENSDFINGNLSNFNCTDSSFCSAILEGAQLERTSFVGSNFDKADLTNALTGADLTNADLSGADLSSAQNLRQAQIDSAKGDATTKLPEDINMPEHWDQGSKQI